MIKTTIILTLENVYKIEILKTEHDLQYEYIVQGAIIQCMFKGQVVWTTGEK